MGGETAGGQGEVRIWAPQRWRGRQLIGPALVGLLWFVVAGALLVMVNTYPIMWTAHVMGVLAALGIVALMRAFGEKVYARLWPSYLSTDNAGIAYVTDSESVALAWEEIVGCRRLACRSLALETRSNGLQMVSLAGFARSDVRSLISVIRANAVLVDVIPRAPDPRLSAIRSAHAAADQRNSWGFAVCLVLARGVFRFVVPPGPLFARAGETLESLNAARDAKALPDHIEETSGESSGKERPDISQLR